MFIMLSSFSEITWYFRFPGATDRGNFWSCGAWYCQGAVVISTSSLCVECDVKKQHSFRLFFMHVALGSVHVFTLRLFPVPTGASRLAFQRICAVWR